MSVCRFLCFLEADRRERPKRIGRPIRVWSKAISICS